MATIDDFHKVDIRVGVIVDVQDFPEARKPAYKLMIDFGPEIGKKRSSAQITHYYTKEELVGKKILGIVNFPPRQIGPFVSVLTLGVPDENNQVILAVPEKPENALIGGKLF